MHGGYYILLIAGTAAVLYGCGKPEMARPSLEPAAAQSTEPAASRSAEQTVVQGTGENADYNSDPVAAGEHAQDTGSQGFPEDVYTDEALSYDKFFEKDGKSYEKVPDLVEGRYNWASALTSGTAVKDGNGCESIDYNSQSRSFERLDGGKKLGVRRWDNLLYSAGDYLIFEYDGTVHVSEPDDLYHPVLSYDKGATHQIVTKVPDGYMIADDQKYTVAFYDEDFKLTRLREGYRYLENGKCYCDGLMAVRDMNTGLMGFMDQSGDIAIPCEYGYVSDFSNGYASVLAGGSLRPFTEAGGAISMFDVDGGQWGIIDIHGNYAVEPSEKYANPAPDPDAPSTYYCGSRRFSEVREDGTVDFMDVSAADNQVIETIRLH